MASSSWTRATAWPTIDYVALAVSILAEALRYEDYAVLLFDDRIKAKRVPDPVEVLCKGEVDTVGPSILALLREGASAVWPGCGLRPETATEHMEALMSALREELQGHCKR
ncbi:MAG: hypothetical protein U0411_00550 [Thermodesulfovibrionales bacterium]